MSLALEYTASPPIASLSSLPTEIKTIIVNLAQEQDENYKRRIKSENQDESELIEGILKENKWRGKSLNALFLVNKEFSNLAAVQIFEHLSSLHVNSESFLFDVLPYRANLVRSVLFVNDSKFSSETLSHLVALPNIKQLGFYDQAVESLFGDLVKPGISGTRKQNSHYSALVAASRRITGLDIVADQVSQIVGILSSFIELENLRLYFQSEEPNNEEEMQKLGVKLSHFSLQAFTLQFVFGVIPESWYRLVWKSFTSLKSLECTLSNELTVLDNTFFSFLNKFTSLEYLKLRLQVQDTAIRNPESTQLTQLTDLWIQCGFIQFSSVLLHFTASPLVLFYFETGQTDLLAEEHSSIETSLLKFVNQHQQTLKRIEVCSRFIEFDFSTLSRLCESHNIILIFSTWEDQHIYEEDYPLLDLDQFNYRRPLLEKALDFGKNKLVELENDNDVEGLKEMFDNCKWLRAGLAEKED